jgi:hypothetical protein
MRRGGVNYTEHTDDLGSGLALTLDNGTVSERYDYADYGLPEFFNGAGVPVLSSAAENPHLFAGLRFDAETGTYVPDGEGTLDGAQVVSKKGSRYVMSVAHFRVYYPRTGAWQQRDPIGVWGDAAALGGGVGYVGASPATYVDRIATTRYRVVSLEK